jgi:hypothetical protein
MRAQAGGFETSPLQQIEGAICIGLSIGLSSLAGIETPITNPFGEVPLCRKETQRVCARGTSNFRKAWFSPLALVFNVL